jgi:hypothetical protein
LNETRFGPKKSRPQYISAQKISTLLMKLPDNFQMREHLRPCRSPINYYKQKLLNQAVYDPVLTLYNDHIFVHFTFITIQWEHVNLNSLENFFY